jgi:hypothetical protein
MSSLSIKPPYSKQTLVAGRPATIRCMDVGGQVYTLGDGALRILQLEDEWYEDVENPEAVLAELARLTEQRIDIFTFWQRYPDVQPRFPYHTEWQDIAVLPIESYSAWWEDGIKSRVRNLIRKSYKQGLTVRVTAFDDAFIQGMTRIFNETPVRQGRRFWHYGKDFATVKTQFSRYIHREHMIGAYLDDELVGFMMIGNAGRFGLVGQLMSSIRHRDKAPNNALIAKAVESCADLGLPSLIYLYWSEDSLAEFKRRCGFQKVRIPRYYVPLTSVGSLALKTGVHRGVRAMVPAGIKSMYKRARARWNGRLDADA